MEHQQEDEGNVRATAATEAKTTSTSSFPVVTKRSPRMLHESSYATSVFTNRGHHRPPGFIASSLDYKSSTVSSAAISAPVTTKPGRNNNQRKQQQQQQQQEQLEREQQYQQQRQYRSGHPTRAQGNFGPPPQAVKTLDDLDDLSEEQIYNLFVEDPDLHAAFIKASENGEYKGKYASIAASSSPAGARRARRSAAGKKPSSSYSKSKRSTKPKTLKPEPVEKEVPYFQWLFLLILVGVAINQIRKSFFVTAPATNNTKDGNGASKKTKGGKQKYKKGGKVTWKVPLEKKVLQKKQRSNPHVKKKEIVAAPKKSIDKQSSSTSNKKKKKEKKSKSKIVLVSKDEPKEKDHGRQEEQQEPDLDSTDGSSPDHEPETDKSDFVVQMESIIIPSSPTIDENDEAWQTVDKSSKGGKKGSTTITQKLVEEKNDVDEPIDVETKEVIVSDKTKEEAIEHIDELPADEPINVETKEDIVSTDETKEEAIEPLDEVPAEETDFVVKKKKTRKKKSAISSNNSEKENSSAPQPAANTNEAGPVVKEDKKESEVKPLEKSDIDKGEPAATATEDDAALALQLHIEEVNLARARQGNPQEESWEEVTTKKKKSL